MEASGKPYVELQRHLDRQAIGFPATKTGAELKILKHIFSPEEARIATCLTYTPEPVDVVFERVGHIAANREVLIKIVYGSVKQ